MKSTVTPILNISRIPGDLCDHLSAAPDKSLTTTRSVLVFVRDFMYTIEVLDEASTLLEQEVIEQQLSQVVADVSSRIKNGEVAAPISVLSADGRTRWAQVCNLIRL